MKLKDLQAAIDNIKASFGEGHLESEIYLDFTFDNEIIVQVGPEAFTRVCILPIAKWEEE